MSSIYYEIRYQVSTKVQDILWSKFREPLRNGVGIQVNGRAFMGVTQQTFGNAVHEQLREEINELNTG